jgi:crotonobetainyl-CoA:carnitine CoA-transferase CaiB-like acyl-CoA transferase
MSGPLHELKILDFTTLLPGPYATMALADMGAHVLRVISGSRPDMVAYIPPFLPVFPARTYPPHLPTLAEVSVASIEPQFFAAFCTAINCPDLIPEGIDPPDSKNVKSRIRQIIKTKTRGEWTELFRNIDACVEPVLSLSEVLNDTTAKERGIVVEVDCAYGKTVR